MPAARRSAAGGRGRRSTPRRAAQPVAGAAATRAAGEPERLQKVLARAGLASRREVEQWIRAGRLSVNGRPAQLGTRVGPEDAVLLDGRKVHLGGRGAPSARTFLCHRSPGEPLRTSDSPLPTDASTAPAALLERLPGRAGRRFVVVSPMPRIDGGLELVSADGELAARLQRGVRHVVSEFGVRVRGELTAEQLQQVSLGILDSGARLPVLACQAAGGEGSNRWYTLSVRGGSGKEIRQLFERQGALVSRILRTRFGPLQLERALARGHYREVSPEELAALTAAASAAGASAAEAAAATDLSDA
ncbi:MAG: 23S rRNA pseudouridylate synthase B [Proteobacteria bacterium]|nr:23S rRNA pseudouridylate synthase B [Pseudomonadota bacterium]